MIFSGLEQVKEFLEIDKNKYDLSPIRFINVETLDIWVKLKAYLVSICSETIALSEFCEEADTTPNLNRLMMKLKKAQRNTLVVPLSEHLRLNNAVAKQTLEKILKMNFDNYYLENYFRIYIPIYRMKSLIKDLSGNDKRCDNVILFVDSPPDNDYSLTVIQNSLNVNLSGNEIFDYKKYLSYWEQNPDKPIVLHTGNAIYYSNIVFADDVTVIVSSYELLRYHYNLNETIEENWGTQSEWDELVKHFKVANSFDFVMLEIFNVNKYDVKLMLSNWRRYSSFEKWLFWLWSKIKAKAGYLGYIIKKSKSYEDFIPMLCSQISEFVNHKDYIEFYIERKRLIELIQLNNLPTDFWSIIGTLPVVDKIKCLTDLTEKEKKAIFLEVHKTSIDDKILNLLKLVYHDLYSYLLGTESENELFGNYFELYKICKVKNVPVPEFIEKVNEIAKEKGSWWQLNSRNYIIDGLYDNDTIIYYIDALGIEFLNMIKSILQSKGISVNVKIGYCNIPSTTEKNNDFIINRKYVKESDLDTKKHEKADFPANIINEFDLIKKFTDKAIRLLDENKRVIITSDHGASRVAVMVKGQSIKASEQAKIERHGRYCIDEENVYGNRIAECIDSGCYHVFANYDRFSISGAPQGEIHGGATLEEVLVPVIILQKEEIIHEVVGVNLLTPEIKQTASSKVRVKFTLTKKYEKVVAVVDNHRYECVYSDGYWYFEPEVGKKDIYTARIVSKETLGTFEYKIKKGISSNFDI